MGARILTAQRSVWCLGKRRDLVVPHAQGQQLLARDAKTHQGLRRCVARPDILLFRDGVSLPKGLIASGQILLQVVREPGCKIFPLRIGDLAPLQDRQNLILDDVIPGVRAQLGNRA